MGLATRNGITNKRSQGNAAYYQVLKSLALVVYLLELFDKGKETTQITDLIYCI